jgi:hypothetical protein
MQIAGLIPQGLLGPQCSQSDLGILRQGDWYRAPARFAVSVWVRLPSLSDWIPGSDPGQLSNYLPF